ncbi:somatostatin receptor type 5-like [Amphiura filiformis]|uniref:somatostatin receptor type 5-like n=1 Tax=Amphiura filiformis TaxID=82378 RepID=UPI003B21E405
MEGFNETDDQCFANLTVKETLSYLYTPFGKYFVLVIVPIISAFGLFANGSFLYVVYRNQHMRTITNFYLVNLAIADGFLLFAGGLQYIWSFAHSAGLNFGGTFAFDSPAGCALPNMLIYFCYFASVFLITLVTTERYLAICHTMRYRISRKRAIFSIVAAWIMALLFAGFEIPYFVVQKVCVSWPPEEEYSEYPTVVPVCFHGCDWCVSVVLYADIIQYLLAVPTVIYMSIAMVLKLRHSLTRKGSIRSTKSTQARQNLVRMLQINAFIFFICLTPFEIINLNGLAKNYKADFLNAQQSHYIKWIGRITMLINSAVNPVIYSIVNASYRNAFLKECCCCCPDRKRTAKTEYELVTSRTGRTGASSWRGSTNNARTSHASISSPTELQWT